MKSMGTQRNKQNAKERPSDREDNCDSLPKKSSLRHTEVQNKFNVRKKSNNKEITK